MIRKLGMSVSLLLILYILLVGAAELPAFGEKNNPVHNQVSERYIQHGPEETGAMNIVAAVILDYRAFDTLGEAVVLFVSIGAATATLMAHSGKQSR